MSRPSARRSPPARAWRLAVFAATLAALAGGPALATAPNDTPVAAPRDPTRSGEAAAPAKPGPPKKLAALPKKPAFDALKNAKYEVERAAAVITALRQRAGLGPVAVDGKLTAMAASYARTLTKVGALTHGDFASRMGGLKVRAAAENLAYRSIDVDSAIAQWRGSSAHNANILNPAMRRIGLAHADGATRYWVLILTD